MTWKKILRAGEVYGKKRKPRKPRKAKVVKMVIANQPTKPKIERERDLWRHMDRWD